MAFTVDRFRPDDADWVVAQHAAHYTQIEGFDATFAPLVADIIAAFLEADDQPMQAGWIARKQGERMGCIFCVRQTAEMAKLRLFFVAPEGRGTGIAQALLDQCLAFAKAAGYHGLTLWTHESHRAAGAIYARNGLQRISSKPVHSFGVDLVEETWQITF